MELIRKVGYDTWVNNYESYTDEDEYVELIVLDENTSIIIQRY